MSWALQNTALYVESSVVFTRDEGIPVEWLAKLARDEGIPVEWRDQFVAFFRDESIPIEWPSRLTRDETVPVEWRGREVFLTRNEAVPAEWTGLPSGQLLLVWRVLNRLNAGLALQWLVISGALNQSLQLQWSVKQALIPLTLKWTVLPPIVALGSQDVQRPTSIEQKTP